MKYLLIISCLLFTSAGWSKTIDSDNLILKDGLYYEKFTDKPFTGKVTGEEQGKIIKGKREGEWLTYYENGKLKYKINFKKQSHKRLQVKQKKYKLGLILTFLHL